MFWKLILFTYFRFMINFVLNIKSWKLFGLTFGIGFVLHFIMMVVIVFGILTKTENSLPILPFIITYLFLIGLSFFILLFWLWTITMELNKRLTDDLKINLKRFKISLIVPAMYLFGMSVTFIIGAALYGTVIISLMLSPLVIILLFIIILIMIVSFYHAIWTTSKVLKTAELKRPIKPVDLILEFILLSIIPVGIWFVQPKVQDLLSASSEKNEASSNY